MSADTHTSASRPAASRPAADDEGPSGALLIAAPGRNSPLTWAQDSSVLPEVGARAPRLRQMLGVCGWAALLGLVGLVVGFRGFIGALMDVTPSWYEPTMIGVGIVGIGFTVAAFASVHRRRTPYILLAAATLVLAYAILLTETTL